MQIVAVIIAAALIFGICYAVDTLFKKIFRNKAQHMSGMAVRVSKRYGLFGVVFTALGLLAVVNGTEGDRVLLWGGAFVLLLGAGLAVHYLTCGIFYDGETFLVSTFARKSTEYRFEQIVSQKLYVVTGGNIIIELQMDNGRTVSLQSNMEGVYTFLDTAFAGWCLQKGIDPTGCHFHDPSKSWWFPHEEEDA